MTEHYYLPIAGTGAFDREYWARSQSDFSYWMRGIGLQPLPYFPWDGKLDGIIDDDVVWPAASEHLADRLLRMEEVDRMVLGHSYGGTIPIYAMARRRVKIHKLILMGTPVRKRHQALLAKAIADGCIQAQSVWHVYASGGFWNDWTQWAGQWFDGDWTTRRWWSIPGVQNVGVKGIDHSRALHFHEDWERVFIASGVGAFMRDERQTAPLRRRIGL